MARTKEYNREKVLDAATHIFWVNGYKGTSMNDLVTATGLNKHSMYQEFGNKEGLFQECIDNFVLNTNKEIHAILTRRPLGFNNIEAFFHNRIDYILSNTCNGCMIVNSAIEKELIDEQAFDKVEKYLSRHEDAFYQCLMAAQKAGQIVADKDCKVMANYLLTFTAGLMVISKTEPNKKSLEALVEMTLANIKAG